jgi:two-component system, OmpR family, sensor histidine kinase VicK
MSSKENLLFKNMIDHSDETFLIYDIAEHRFIYANTAFEKITKRSREQLLKDPASMLDAIHPDDQVIATRLFNSLLRKRTSTLLDFRILRPDKTERWIRLKTYPIIEDNKLAYLTGMMEDDSSRKASIFNMQKVNGWKDSILEILAHDLRGPISIVDMLASAIDQQLNGDNQEIHKWTKMIRDISKRNIQLIHTLIKKESLNTAEVPLNKERIDLVTELRGLMKIYFHAQGKAVKKFEYTHSHETIFARVDSMKFLQVINNLISNSIKFTGTDGHIKVHLEGLDQSALITISDNGIGIPRNLKPFLFNKYTQAGRNGVDGQESVGLGMWIVKSFTEAHGGNVWIESEEGKGTTVYVEIPKGYEELDLENEDDFSKN